MRGEPCYLTFTDPAAEWHSGQGWCASAAIWAAVLELAQRVPEHLHQRLVETNEVCKLVRHVPSLEHVAGWVEHAGKLARVVSY